MSGVYGTRPLKRHRRTKSELQAVDEALVTILRTVKPATVRQMFYQAVVHDLVPKDDKGYGLVQRRLLNLRRQKVVSYSWITDNIRMVLGYDRYPGIESFSRDVASLYRRDYWANAPVNVEIWIEADSLASTISPVVIDEWGLDLHVARGFSSETYLHNSGEALRQDGREAFIYILSDFDPSGLVLAEKVAEGLHKFARGVSIHVERLALTYEQVLELNLPTHGLKATDSRAPSFRRQYGDKTAELDALPPTVLRQLVGEAIARHADPAEISRLKLIESAERETIESAWGQA